MVHQVPYFELHPNPASTSTLISYNLDSASDVTLTVLDMTGRVAMNLNEGQKNRGKNSIELNVASLSAGVYSYTLTAGNSSLTKEMIVK